MPASFDLDAGSVPLWDYALPVTVCAYSPDGGYSTLPNVLPLRVDRREGCVPSAARFAYRFDDAMAATYGWPNSFEQVFGLYVSPNPYVVFPDQRLVVLSRYPDGSPWVLWDGFAQVPQMDVSGGAQHVTFTGVGVESRCWDTVLAGSVRRDSDPIGIADTSGDSDVLTDLRPRFNPADAGGGSSGARGGSLPNCSPEGKDTVDPETGWTYPVFVDAGIERTPDPRRYWTVGRAVRYVLGVANASEDFVTNPPWESLDDLLQTYQTAPGSAVLDPADPSTYVVAPVQVPDLDIAGLDFPEAVKTLIAYVGFLARFDTYADADGMPQTLLNFYRRDEFSATAPKAVYLGAPQAGGATLDPGANNARDIHLSMDLNGVINAYQVETAQRRVEVSWILAPLYRPSASDAQAANRRKFFRSNLAGATADVQRAYRWYGADECGDGHWTLTGSWSTVPCDFQDVFPPDKQTGNPTFVTRYRPGSRTLIATDSDGNPLKADLSISFDYAGATRAPWDGSGTWQSIPGGWRLLPDRLGIEVTAEDPENWSTGNGPAAIGGGAAVVPGGAVRGVSWWAAPPSSAPHHGLMPRLRLTTVIEDDRRIAAQAPARVASPTQFARWRQADRRDQFEYAAVDVSSMYYSDEVAQPDAVTNDLLQVVIRDDTDAARALADQLRGAHEFPTLAGSITIPYITDYYQIGDRIEAIAGRDCSLQTNIATDQGEAPTYPWVVGVSWNFDGRQETILSLSDRRALPRLPLVSYRHGRH